jgi:cyclic dehypoxanthinyl futalosine synthase
VNAAGIQIKRPPRRKPQAKLNLPRGQTHRASPREIKLKPIPLIFQKKLKIAKPVDCAFVVTFAQRLQCLEKQKEIMQVGDLLDKALKLEWLTPEEGVFLLENAATADLMQVANQLRQHHVPGNIVTWIIDRNSNTTNVCIANCKFCNFYRRPGHEESYTTSIEEYKQKIDELFEFGGEQLLLQGGHHPDLGLDFYVKLFKELKELYPTLKLHALGPPEIAHIAKLDGLSHIEVLRALQEAGMDSLPGAGAEILSDRVRRLISKGKCGGQEWLDVMRAAHKLHMTTSATMMFGHIETNMERMEHLAAMRQVQSERPEGAKGFIAFIPWPFQDEDTILKRLKRARNTVTGDEYVRMIALSRIMLPNIPNIQASWLTVGKQVAQVCLHAGANDFGSIMIEENVVSAAGARFRFTANGIQDAIREAGFEPRLRNQQYEFRELPENIRQQELDSAEMIVD